MRFFERRPLGWLLLGSFAGLYACWSTVAAVGALADGHAVTLFWRVVELLFFAWVAAASIRRTDLPPSSTPST